MMFSGLNYEKNKKSFNLVKYYLYLTTVKFCRKKMISSEPTIYIVAGLLFGDEGKGTTVDFLVREKKAKLVARFNGGSQAMHHVVFPDGSWHCFAQFGAGSFVPGCKTLISKYMLISPHTLIREAKCLIDAGQQDIIDRLHIDLDCVIITPFHQLLNRVTETLRGKKSHGTTGMGVGAAAEDAFKQFPKVYPYGELFVEKDADKKLYTCLQIRDLLDEKVLKDKLKNILNEKLTTIRGMINDYKEGKFEMFHPEYLEVLSDKPEIDMSMATRAREIMMEYLNEHTVDSMYEFYSSFAENYSKTFVVGSAILRECLEEGDNVVLEGAQGALLDKIHGIFPHITRTVCTDSNAMALIKDAGVKAKIVKIGVLRVYSSRHGNGPFISHDTTWSQFITEDHNRSSGWQGDFRVGPFDFVGAAYSIQLFQPDFLSITCLDKLAEASTADKKISEFHVCASYKIQRPIENKQLSTSLNDSEFLKVSETEEAVIIKGIAKRKPDVAYGNLDLLRVLKDAKPVLVSLGELQGVHKIDEDFQKEVEGHTKTLLKVEETTSKQLSQYVAVLQRMLDVPIGILSFGATFKDKVFVHGLEKL